MQLLIICFFALAVSIAAGSHQCGENEKYKRCNGCDQVCNREPIFCTQDCSRPGCYCKPGYIRADGKENSCCVRPTQCPKPTVFPPSTAKPGPKTTVAPSSTAKPGPDNQDPDSSEYEYYEDDDYYYQGGSYAYAEADGGGSYAEAEADGADAGADGGGSYADAGADGGGSYADAGADGSYADAEAGDDSYVAYYYGDYNQCKVNEEYKDCGGCDKYCNAGPIACAAGCGIPGCYCKPDYVRYLGVCIPSSNCPRKEAPDSSVDYSGDYNQCNVNEEYNGCGGCDQYCNEEPIFCSAGCNRPGCYCRPGYIRYLGICIPSSNCPRNQAADSSIDYDGEDYEDYNQCKVNEVYNECSGCDQYCNEKPRACDAGCGRPGCYCRPGYVRYLDICIPPANCPRNQASDYSVADYGDYYQCNVNEEYNDCGGCDQYCNEKPRACAAVCGRPGCYCRLGYVRYLNICIPPSSCPRNQPSDSSTGNNGAPNPPIEIRSSGRSDSRRSEAAGPSPVNNAAPNPPIEIRSSGRSDSRSSPGTGPSAGNNAYPNPPPKLSSSGRSGTYKCRPNEAFNPCGVGQQCEDYCGRGPNACAYCQPGCYCNDGLIRAGPSNRTICIPPNQCPAKEKCPPNEEFNDCGPACEDSCDTTKQVCSKNCVASCFCKKGYIRQHDETQTTRYKCIPQSQCIAQ